MEENKKRHGTKYSILTMFYHAGSKQDKLFSARDDKEFKECEKFRKFIDEESEKRNKKPFDLIEYFVDHKEELLKAYKFSKKIKEKLEEGLIKASIHSLNQKFGNLLIPGQLSIFDNLEDRGLVQEAKNLSIKILGWDLTRAEDQAVFAIQKIYSKYGYKGNVNDDKNNSLIFTLPEFYESYGVLKYEHKGKERFSDAEKDQAYAALINLTKKQCIIAYRQLDMESTKKKKMQIFNRIETLSAIIPEIDFLYTDLSKKEDSELDNGKHKTEKLRAIKIAPSRVFLDQIGNYYALLPSNLYTEIKEKLPGVKNFHLPMFIQWLAKENALRRRNNLSSIIEIGFEKLSYILRMDIWIKAGQKQRIDDRIMNCFKQAKTLSYLKDYKITKGKTVSKKVTLYININKFKPQKQAEEIIYDSDPKEEFEEDREREIYQEKLKNLGEVRDPEVVRKAKEKLKAIRGY